MPQSKLYNIIMKTVIITGATRGIGAAAAFKFASADYAICAVYRQDDSSARVLIDKLASNGSTMPGCRRSLPLWT